MTPAEIRVGRLRVVGIAIASVVMGWLLIAAWEVLR